MHHFWVHNPKVGSSILPPRHHKNWAFRSFGECPLSFWVFAYDVSTWGPNASDVNLDCGYVSPLRFELYELVVVEIVVDVEISCYFTRESTWILISLAVDLIRMCGALNVNSRVCTTAFFHDPSACFVPTTLGR